MNISNLKLILLYYFDYKNGVSTWKKDKLVGTIAEKFAERGESTTFSAHLPTRPSDNTKE